jgi:hypothetical protein
MSAAVKIDCEFLAADSWQVEGKQRIVGHGGCGARLIREATRRNNDLLRESLASRHSLRRIPHALCIIRVSFNGPGRWLTHDKRRSLHSKLLQGFRLARLLFEID